MSAFFIKIFNLGVTAGWIVLAVLLLRPLLQRAPKWINCLLWGIVGLRLIFPFSLESVFSLIPSAEPLPSDITMTQTPAINSGIGAINTAVNPIISDSLSPAVGASVNPMQIIVEIAAYVWVIGIALMLIYGTVSYIRLALKVRVSVKQGGNIYFCDEVDSPFILGVIRPRIYLPSGMRGEEMGYVIEHEEAHLKRRDHLWKPIGYALLAVYWFNPLLWVAYVLLCRDIEMACDERVIKRMDSDAKKGYSEALVACSIHRKRIMACPLSFGEVGVKERIKSVLNYKKPAFWVIIVALVATVIVSVCFLTNPRENVRDLLEPGSEWRCDGDAEIEVTVDNMIRMTGSLSFEGQNDEIVIRYRNEGKSVYADIFKSEADELNYDGNGDGLVSADEYSDAYAGPLLLSGVLRARGEDFVLKVEEDNLGIGEEKLVFKKTRDSGNRTVKITDGEDSLYVNVTDCGSEKSGIEVSFIQAKREGGDVVFVLKWKNRTAKVQIYGESFELYRYEGDELIALEPIGAWKEVAVGVSAFSMSYPTFNITEHYDISVPGQYRLSAGGAWVEFEVVREDKEEQNEENNTSVVFDPSYSAYDFSRKYDVYVWQMAQNSFSFGLLESKQRSWLDDELWNLKGVRAAEMRQTLLKNNLGPNDVYIVRWQHPLSSYIGDFWVIYPYMNDNTPQENLYYAIIYDMLFGTSPRNYYPTATENEWFDIDGDGVKEDNRLFFGLVDGKFMFRYIISEDNKTAAYDDTFYTEPMSLKFFTADGKLRLRGVTEDGGAHVYDILLEDGHIKLNEIEVYHPEMAGGLLDLSKADFSLVDRIVITNGSTGEKYYMSNLSNRTGFVELYNAIKSIKAAAPVSNRGYYGFTYHVELYYDYQTVFSFSLCPEAYGASIICGYYETVGGFDYPARYRLTEPLYAKLDDVLRRYFK